MDCASPKDTRWSAEILGHGHHDVPDVGRGLQAAAAPDARVDAEYREALEIGSSGARFLDLVASRAGADPSSVTSSCEN